MRRIVFLFVLGLLEWQDLDRKRYEEHSKGEDPDRKKNLDDLEVRLEVGENVFSDVMADMVALQRSVADKLQSVLGLRARVTLVEPGAIERTAGKAKRVVDLRDQG